MNRYGFALIALALVLLLLALAFCNVPVEAQDATGTPHCRQYNADHTWLEIGCPDDQTAAPTHTPTPSSTPSPTATHTPTPTSTPTPTPEPTVEPSPTPEQGICHAFVGEYNLHVRTQPGGDSLGVHDAGEPVTITAYWDYNGARWYRVWGTFSGWSHGDYLDFPPDADCTRIEDETPGTTREPALLWHSVPNSNSLRMLDTYWILQDKNIQFGVKPYAEMNQCLDALNAGGICIFRHGAPDCPQNIGTANPRESARDFAKHGWWAAQTLRGYENAYWEIVNECYFGDDNHPEVYVWWAEWIDEILIVTEAEDYPKVVVPTTGPGHGTPMQYEAWKMVLNRSASYGNLIGEHAYTPGVEWGLCECDEWLACRHRKNEAWRQEIGIDIDVAITEAARAWGSSAVDVDDFVCWYEQVRNDEYVHSVALWTMGPWSLDQREKLDDYAIPIAQRVQARD